MDLRLRSNKARLPLARKHCGRRVFCSWPALARSFGFPSPASQLPKRDVRSAQSSQPAAGMLGARVETLRRLGPGQNPSPQAHS